MRAGMMQDRGWVGTGGAVVRDGSAVAALLRRQQHVLTHRQARRKTGSRTTRRAGTKTQVMPGGKSGGKGAAPKFKTCPRQKARPATRVWALVDGAK